MTTLTDFLLARIAGDEAAARKLAETDRRPVLSLASTINHPARLLAECEAKRRIVETLVDAEAAVATYDSDDPNNPPSYWQEWGNRHALRLAAELHAATYADHADYNEAWRP